MTNAQALELKKLTFLAWTNHLFSKGMITPSDDIRDSAAQEVNKKYHEDVSRFT